MRWSNRFAGWRGWRLGCAKWADAARDPKSKTEDAAALHSLMLALRVLAILRRTSSIAAAVLLLTLTATVAIGQSMPSQTLEPSASLKTAEQLLDAGHPEEAIGTLRQLAAMQPPVKGAAHALGLACYRTGKLLEARTAFE